MSARPEVPMSAVEVRRVPTAIGRVGHARRAAAAGREATGPSAPDGRALIGRSGPLAAMSAAAGRAVIARSGPLAAMSAAAGRAVIARSVAATGTSVAAGRAVIARSGPLAAMSAAAGRAAIARSVAPTGTSVAAGRPASGPSALAIGTSVLAGRTGPSAAATVRSAVAGRAATGPSAPARGTSDAEVRARTGPSAVAGRVMIVGAATTGHGLLGPAMTGRRSGPMSAAGQAPDDRTRARDIAARRGPTRTEPATSTSAWTCPTPSQQISLIPRRWQS